MKKVIIIIFISIFYFSCKNNPEKLNDNNNIENSGEAKLPEGAIPIKYLSHIYLTTLIDGLNGNFVFDTGADNLYLDSIFYYDNNFKHINTMPAYIPGVGNDLMKITIIKDSIVFYLGEKEYVSSWIPILKLKPILGDFADGIVGNDFFYNSIMEINYEKEYIKLYSNIDSVDILGYRKIPMIKNEKESRFFVPLQVSINDSMQIAGNFLFDIGSGGSISFTNAIGKKYNLEKIINEKTLFYSKYGGIGGESSSYTFKANSINIADYILSEVFVDFSNDKSGALSDKEYIGILGNEILDRFDVIIDFINRDLYLKANDKFSEPFEAARLGFSYSNRNKTLNAWVVSGFYEKSNAEKSGLMIDDKIITINGIDVKKIDFDKEKLFFDEIDKVDLKVIRKDADTLDIRFTLESIL